MHSLCEFSETLDESKRHDLCRCILVVGRSAFKGEPKRRCRSFTKAILLLVFAAGFCHFTRGYTATGTEEREVSTDGMQSFWNDMNPVRLMSTKYAQNATPSMTASPGKSARRRAKYCVVQITTRNEYAKRASAIYDAKISTATLYDARTHVYINERGMHAAVVFDALSAANELGTCGDSQVEWYFIGDDDTLFYRNGIEQWLQQRQPQRHWLVSHGNLWEARKLDKSWFTGGSGFVLSAPLVRQMIFKYKKGDLNETINEAFSWCNCFDVPLCRGITMSGGRMFHQPNLFLDSCLDCARDRRGLVGVQIIACHAATIFREQNPHAVNKGGDEFGEILRGGDYSQHPDFKHVTEAHERRIWFDKMCADTRK